MSRQTDTDDSSTYVTPPDVDVTGPLEAAARLPWVTGVFETARPNATHYLSTDLSVLRWGYEIHDLQNCQVDIESISTTGDTARVYVHI